MGPLPFYRVGEEPVANMIGRGFRPHSHIPDNPVKSSLCVNEDICEFRPLTHSRNRLSPLKKIEMPSPAFNCNFFRA